MNRDTFKLIESYMLLCMGDSAHDKDHIYRVLYNAMDIAGTEQNVDYDVLICACLLHDIGRKEQFENPELCHAMVGGEKAYQFLLENSFDTAFADKVKHCIQTHRYRQNNPPQSLEAKILFDSDKIDATGALGIARTLFYKGTIGEHCIRSFQTAECPMEQLMITRHFSKSISTSSKSCTTISILQGEMRLQRSVNKQPLHFTTICSERLVIPIIEE